MPLYEKLLQLAEDWEGIARRKFVSAENLVETHQCQPTGKQFVEHGAACYLNCASNLREVLIALSPLLSTIQQEDQT